MYINIWKHFKSSGLQNRTVYITKLIKFDAPRAGPMISIYACLAPIPPPNIYN